MIILITGPARSGKSEWAEYLAAKTGTPVTYIATSLLDASDAEWVSRVDKHRSRRPAVWKTLEVPVELTLTLKQNNLPHSCLLVDSLGTWIANLLEEDDNSWQAILEVFISTVTALETTVIFVGEETGWGLVPAYPVGRLFRDRLGMLIRSLGAISDEVYLVTGGYVLNLTEIGIPLPQKNN